MRRPVKGYVQVYTGEGKGKTTAAFGLALRSAGAGLRVYIAQFLKGVRCSELAALERFSDLITVRQYGGGEFIRGTPAPADAALAEAGLEEVRAAIRSGAWDVVILDEANMAVSLNVLRLEDLIGLIETRPESVELVITGRYAPPEVVARADLITEMREVRHYYSRGVKARRGIEN